MPRAIPLPIRQKVWQRARRGEPTRSLAAAFGLSPRTVRSLCRRFRARGTAGLPPDYHPPQPSPQATPPEAVEAACQLRRQHPSWGAGIILVLLREECPQQTWPSERTVQRWLRKEGLAPARAGRRPGSNPDRAAAPHEVWQMDASEQIALANERRVSWLRMTDEHSGAVLRTAVFPPGLLEQG